MTQNDYCINERQEVSQFKVWSISRVGYFGDMI